MFNVLGTQSWEHLFLGGRARDDFQEHIMFKLDISFFFFQYWGLNPGS
jgi:hypothetical protein